MDTHIVGLRPRNVHQKWYCVAVLFLLSIHTVILARSAYVHSPVTNEVHFLASGLSQIYVWQFDLFRVNPPLVRTVAAAPVAMMLPKVDWSGYDSSPTTRSEMTVGQDFAKANGSKTLLYITTARWAVIPFSLLGGWICYLWATKLYGQASGIMALILWCFCPYILGHASTISTDAHSASMGIVAAYAFWLWLQEPVWWKALVAGLVLGLAELCKFTLLVFYPLWLAIWIIYRLPDRRKTNHQQWFREAGMLASIIILSIYIINLGYGFEGSLKRLGDFRFQSALFTGLAQKEISSESGNRFSGTWLGSLLVPVPMNYLQGIDTQKADFVSGRLSYLNGEWKKGGWWYYYLYALAIKLPLGTWALFFLAVGASLFIRGYSVAWRDELVLLLPAFAILILVSSETGFSIHSRYILPMLPFIYIWISKVGRCVQLRQWKITAIVGAALCWAVVSSLWYYPHSLSYFNELVGGPKNGHYYLLDSNISWGQDLFYLKEWLDEHPQAKPFHFACLGYVDPQLAGIDFVLPATGLASPTVDKTDVDQNKLGPLPGWYAIDVNHLHGSDAPVACIDGGIVPNVNDNYNYCYFQRFQPVAVAGYSIYIYNITLDEANRVRKELGLPELKSEGEGGEMERESRRGKG